MEKINSTFPNKISNQKFGYFFSFFFAGIFTYIYFKHSGLFYWRYLIIAICFFLLTISKPNSLTILNKAWIQLGVLLGKVTNPIILGIFFFFFLTPIGLIVKLVRGDFLNLKNKKKKSYWLMREFDIKSKDFFEHQF